MTLREFIEGLNKFSKENPTALDLLVVTSKDDEGNGYNQIVFDPGLGIFDVDEFIPLALIADYERDLKDINAVCVN